MACDIAFHDTFRSNVKSLKKRFPKIHTDIKSALSRIETNPLIGDAIPGYPSLYKFRIRNSDNGKGKSGGYRLIYRNDPHHPVVQCLAIYSKNDRQLLSHTELVSFLKI